MMIYMNSRVKIVSNIDKLPEIPGIYVLINGDIGHYTGQTKNLYKRVRRHVSNAKAGKRTKLCYALRKYGIHAFKIMYVKCSVDELNDIEAIMIKLTKHMSTSYNMTKGGDYNRETQRAREEKKAIKLSWIRV